MKVKRIIMTYAGYGLPTIEKETKENITLHLYYKTFDLNNDFYKYKNIRQIGFNLYQIEWEFKDKVNYDFCFKPKWYQLIKFYLYFYGCKIINLLKLLKD